MFVAAVEAANVSTVVIVFFGGKRMDGDERADGGKRIDDGKQISGGERVGGGKRIEESD